MTGDRTMLERLEGRAWHGDHLIDAATASDVERLAAIADGTEADGRLVHAVREFTTLVDGAVIVHGFDLSEPQKAPSDDPLRPLRVRPTLGAPSSQRATVRVVSLEPPEGLDAAERMDRELLRDPGVVLATVSWGDVAEWVPAAPVSGAPGMPVEQATLVALGPVERVVPSVTEARAWLAASDAVPGGERRQAMRQSGSTWPSLPTVDSWTEEAADPWVLGGLLGLVADPKDRERSSLLGAPLPQMTMLVPGGAPVLVASAGRGLVVGPTDRILTLWEGRDRDGRPVAFAMHRSAVDVPRLELPLWPGQRPSDPPDGWCGEVMEYVDEPGEEPLRYRLWAKPLGRLTFPSRRIVAADPCVAGRSPAVGIELPDAGPHLVLRVDLVDVMDGGHELDHNARGILVVLDAEEAPVRWEPATDEDGRPIDCGIDSGRLLLGDVEGARSVQRQYDEGTVDHGSLARLSLLRSDPTLPADVAVLGDLGGDGPAWVVVGVAEDGHPVAVMVANFDPLS